MKHRFALISLLFGLRYSVPHFLHFLCVTLLRVLHLLQMFICAISASASGNFPIF